MNKELFANETEAATWATKTSAAEREAVILSLLSNGILDRASRMILKANARVPMDVQLFVLDSQCRMGQVIDVDIKRKLSSLKGGVVTEDLVLWARAILAECFLWQGELAFALSAASGYQILGMPNSRIGLMAYYRLARIVGMAASLAGPREFANGLGILDSCIAKFRELDIEEEAIFTKGLKALAIALQPIDLQSKQVPTAREVLLQLKKLTSDRAYVGGLGLAWIGLLQCDFEAAHEGLAVLSEFGEIKYAPLVKTMREMIKCALEIWSSKKSKDASPKLLLRSAQENQQLADAKIFLVSLLLDFGRVSEAEVVFREINVAKIPMFMGSMSYREVSSRIGLATKPTETSIQAYMKLAGEWKELGCPRYCASLLYRGARDCELAGNMTFAQRLRQGAQVIDAELNISEFVAWERLIRRSFTEEIEQRNSIFVMCDKLRVVRGHLEIKLSPLSQQLLAHLVFHRKFASGEMLARLIWPACGIDEGKTRLKAALTRLRREVMVGRDDFIKYQGGQIVLLAQGWYIDYWEFLKLAEGDSNQKKTALETFSPKFCSEQFPYNDEFIYARGIVAAQFNKLKG